MERRHQIRIPLSTRVVLEHEGRTYSTETANVSEGGMFVPTEEPMPVGTTVDFRLVVPGGREISGSAQVVWSQMAADGPRPQGNGLEFAEIGEGAKLMLLASIRRHLEDQPMIRSG